MRLGSMVLVRDVMPVRAMVRERTARPFGP
jgi:hypothetical protein